MQLDWGKSTSLAASLGDKTELPHGKECQQFFSPVPNDQQAGPLAEPS